MIQLALIYFLLWASIAGAASNPYILGGADEATPEYTPAACTVQDTTDTGTPSYTQDITCSGLGGLTPKAAILLISHATANDTPTAHAKYAWFLTDGTRSRSISGHSEDAVDISDEYYGISETGTLQILTTSTGGTTGEATFNSFIAGGIRLNWTESPGANYRMLAIFYAGADIVNVRVDHITGSAVVGSVDVNTVGFEPDLVFLLTVGLGTTDTANGTAGALGSGWAWNQPTDVNRGIRWGAQDNVDVTVTTVGMHDDASAVPAFGTDFELAALSIDTFDANGFTLNTLEAAGGADEVLYLALEFAAERSVWVGDFTTKDTTTGTKSTTIGFQPYHLAVWCNYMDQIGGWNDAGARDVTSAGSQVFGAGEIASQAAAAYVNEDNVDISDTYSLTSSGNIIALRDETDGTALVTGDFSAASATDFTINYSVVDTTAYQCIGVAIE